MGPDIKKIFNKGKAEDLVNEYINMAIPVEKMEMKKEDALKLGAEAMFIEKIRQRLDTNIIIEYTI